jgi:hypothetical protein
MFHGWKNITIKIPGNIRQRSRQRSGPENMSFVGFRIRSDAAEYVDDFQIFLDRLEYTTNAISLFYDGYALENADFGDNAAGTSKTTGEGSN